MKSFVCYSSCFPKTIIERVLVAGFKDFMNPSLQGNTKFSSAAAILGYLSGQHKAAARKCMIDYLLKSVEEPEPNGANVVTYLLNVASLSIMVIRTITPDLCSISKTTSYYNNNCTVESVTVTVTSHFTSCIRLV